MENIDVDTYNMQVTLGINPDLYSYESVIQASKEFSQNFWVAVYGGKNKEISVTLKPKPEFTDEIGLEELGLEFYNYLLGTMQDSD